MTDLKQHFSARGSASSLLTSRLSRHPERYLEIFRVFRKYELHHIVAELGMSHHHDEDLELDAPHHDDEDDDHGILLTSALEELGPDAILGKLADDRLTMRLDVDHLQDATESLNRAATRLAVGVLAGSLLIGGGQVLSALIRTGAVGNHRNGTR